jgi:hypothetical protein
VAIEKISLGDFIKYMRDVVNRFHARYEQERGRPECPDPQHFGGWLRALMKFIVHDREDTAERASRPEREWDEDSPTRKS